VDAHTNHPNQAIMTHMPIQTREKNEKGNQTARYNWPPLIKGTLIRRYKRFLSDVLLESGEKIVAHCPNSGTMKACCEPGRPVWVSQHDNPRRKLKYTWELIQMPSSLVGVNTLVPNRLAAAAIEAGEIAELRGYATIKREARAGKNSRLDILLKNGIRDCYVEVKNCTLVENGVAAFPDAVTERGRKHLLELQALIEKGCRGVMFYLIQRMDARVFKPADHIDAAYGRELRHAVDNGVEILVYDVDLNLDWIRINRRVPCKL
jgi:sugar fermentation stimulation protein A